MGLTRFSILCQPCEFLEERMIFAADELVSKTFYQHLLELILRPYPVAERLHGFVAVVGGVRRLGNLTNPSLRVTAMLVSSASDPRVSLSRMECGQMKTTPFLVTRG